MSQVSESVGTSSTGSTNAVDRSGSSSMSLSLIAWKPRIDEPSKPSPSRIISSSSVAAGIEKCCQVPGRSQNFTSTTWMFRCWMQVEQLADLAGLGRFGGSLGVRSWPWRVSRSSEKGWLGDAPDVAPERRGIGTLRCAECQAVRWRGERLRTQRRIGLRSGDGHGDRSIAAGLSCQDESCKCARNVLRTAKWSANAARLSCGPCGTGAAPRPRPRPASPVTGHPPMG